MSKLLQQVMMMRNKKKVSGIPFHLLPYTPLSEQQKEDLLTWLRAPSGCRMLIGPSGSCKSLFVAHCLMKHPQSTYIHFTCFEDLEAKPLIQNCIDNPRSYRFIVVDGAYITKRIADNLLLPCIKKGLPILFIQTDRAARKKQAQRFACKKNTLIIRHGPVDIDNIRRFFIETGDVNLADVESLVSTSNGDLRYANFILEAYRISSKLENFDIVPFSKSMRKDDDHTNLELLDLIMDRNRSVEERISYVERSTQPLQTLFWSNYLKKYKHASIEDIARMADSLSTGDRLQTMTYDTFMHGAVFKLIHVEAAS